MSLKPTNVMESVRRQDKLDILQKRFEYLEGRLTETEDLLNQKVQFIQRTMNNLTLEVDELKNEQMGTKESLVLTFKQLKAEGEWLQEEIKRTNTKLYRENTFFSDSEEEIELTKKMTKKMETDMSRRQKSFSYSDIVKKSPPKSKLPNSPVDSGIAVSPVPFSFEDRNGRRTLNVIMHNEMEKLVKETMAGRMANKVHSLIDEELKKFVEISVTDDLPGVAEDLLMEKLNDYCREYVEENLHTTIKAMIDESVKQKTSELMVKTDSSGDSSRYATPLTSPDDTDMHAMGDYARPMSRFPPIAPPNFAPGMLQGRPYLFPIMYPTPSVMVPDIGRNVRPPHMLEKQPPPGF